jgi:ketosteroid isomerase-like protein
MNARPTVEPGDTAGSMEERVRELVDVYNSGDLDAMLALLHDDVVAVVPDGMPNAGVYEGRAGVGTMLAQWGEAWERFRVEPRAFIEAGDAMLVPARQIGRGRGSGIELELEFVWLVRERDGRLVYWRLCQTLKEARALAGGDLLR